MLFDDFFSDAGFDPAEDGLASFPFSVVTLFFPIVFLLELNFPLSARCRPSDVSADGAGVGFGALSPDRQMFGMAGTAIGLDILKPRDILLNSGP